MTKAKDKTKASVTPEARKQYAKPLSDAQKHAIYRCIEAMESRSEKPEANPLAVTFGITRQQAAAFIAWVHMWGKKGGLDERRRTRNKRAEATTRSA